MIYFLFSVFFTTITASLVHRSIAGGDSGELIAAVGCPPAAVVAALNQLAVCAVENPPSISALTRKKSGQKSGQRYRMGVKCEKLHAVTVGVMNLWSDVETGERVDIAIGSEQTQQQSPEQRSTSIGTSLVDDLRTTLRLIPLEFVSATRNAGLAHPPGYPLYLILVRFMVAMSYSSPLLGSLTTPGAFANRVLDSPLVNSTVDELQRTGLLHALSKAFSGSARPATSSPNIDNKKKQQKPRKAATSASPVTANDEAIDDHRDFVEAQALILADYVLRVNATSLVFSACALFCIALSVFFCVLSVAQQQQQQPSSWSSRSVSVVIAALAALVAVSLQLNDTSFLRYAGEAEVFALNQAIVAFGLLSFLCDLHLFSALTLGLVLSHQHAALFVAAPLVLAALLSQIWAFVAAPTGKKVAILAFLWIPALLFFAIGASPLLHQYNLCQSTPQCTANNNSSSDNTFSDLEPTIVDAMPVLRSAWALPCRGDDQPAPYSHSTCVEFVWYHVLRRHYGTFTMTDGSLHEQDVARSKKINNDKNQQQHSQRGKTFVTWFSSFHERCEKHAVWMWREHKIALCIIAASAVVTIVSAIARVIIERCTLNQRQQLLQEQRLNSASKQLAPQNSPRARRFEVAMFMPLLAALSSMVLFAAFSNMNLEDGSGNNLFMHVHERMWLQSGVPLCIAAALGLVHIAREAEATLMSLCTRAQCKAANSNEGGKRLLAILVLLSGLVLGMSSSVATSSFESVARWRAACEDCSVAARAVSMWRGVDVIGSSSSSSPSSSAVGTAATSSRPIRVLFTSGDLHFAPLLFLEPYLRFLSLEQQLGRVVRAAELKMMVVSAAAEQGLARDEKNDDITKEQNAGSSSNDDDEVNSKKQTKIAATATAAAVSVLPFSVTVWIDIEVGSNNWFTNRFLVERFRCMLPGEQQGGDSSSSSLALPTALHRFSPAAIAPAVSHELCQTLRKAQATLNALPRFPVGSGQNQGILSGQPVRRFDLSGAVDLIFSSSSKPSGPKSSNGNVLATEVDLFSLELPEFTALRAELVAKSVDFQSNGPLYQLKRNAPTPAAAAAAAQQHAKSKQQHKTASSCAVIAECNALRRLYELGEMNSARFHCERAAATRGKQGAAAGGKTETTASPADIAMAGFAALFSADVWDHTIESGFNSACEQAAKALRAAQSSSSSSSSSRSFPHLPIRLAWVRQVLDECAGAAKNKLVHALMQLQSTCAQSVAGEDAGDRSPDDDEDIDEIDQCAHEIAATLRKQAPHWTLRAIGSGLFGKVLETLIAVNRSSGSEALLTPMFASGVSLRHGLARLEAEFNQVWLESLTLMLPGRRWAVVAPMARVLQQLVDQMDPQRDRGGENCAT